MGKVGGNDAKHILRDLDDLSKKLKGNDIFRFKDVIDVKSGKQMTELTDHVEFELLKMQAEKFRMAFNENPQKMIDIYDAKGRKVPSRINEFGNMIEILFVDFFEKNNLSYKKVDLGMSSGYPDALFKKENDFYYFELKTFGEGNKTSSLRSFYYSYGNISKVKESGHHILIAFETSKNNAKYFAKTQNKNVILPAELITSNINDLFNLEVKLKAEFNTGNNELYKEKK